MPRRCFMHDLWVSALSTASSIPTKQLGKPMQLDVKTLYLLNIVVALVTAGVSFFSWF